MHIHIVAAISFIGRFPLLSDSYDDLIKVELGLQSTELNSSTLLPMLLERTVLLDWQGHYDHTRSMIHQLIEKVDLQIWFPDEHTERYMYQTNALFDSGVMLTTIKLPESLEQYRALITEEMGGRKK